MNNKLTMSLCLTFATYWCWTASARAEIVFAEVINGTLIVACDDSKDYLSLSSTSGNLVHLYWSGEQGQTPMTLPLTGVVNVAFLMGGGDNRVTMHSESIIGSLDIQTGDGNDTVFLVDSEIGSYTNLDLGDGDNTIITPGTIFGGSLTINTGIGSDLINPGTINQVEATFNGSVLVSLGDGRDSCVLKDCQGNGDFTVRFGNGDNYSLITGDFIGNITVSSADGQDKHVVRGNVAGDISLVSQDGNDTLQVEGCTVQGNLTMQSGGGKDEIRLRLQYGEVEVFGVTTIKSGADADDVFVSDSTFHGSVQIKTAGSVDLVDIGESDFLESLSVDLGSGNDDLLIDDSTSLHSTILQGGSGFDYGSSTNSSLGSGTQFLKLSFEQGNLGSPTFSVK